MPRILCLRAADSTGPIVSFQLYHVMSRSEANGYSQPNPEQQNAHRVDIESQSPRAHFTSDRQPHSPGAASINSIKHRPNRAATAQSYQPQLRGRKWRPGQEPGIDVSSPHGGQLGSDFHQLWQRCDITVVDFSRDDMRMQELDNHSLAVFLQTSKEDWVACRWISVNGLSWDVIRLLGSEKGFHRLAIEDMMNRKNRTKVDWYSDHTYSTETLSVRYNDH